MPATAPTPTRDYIANYPPAAADQIQLAYTQGAPFWLTFAVTFNTADAAVLYTVPTAIARLQLIRAGWEVTTPFTGGTSSTIGLSSSNAAYNTKGDLQGGASGDAAAALVAGFKGGTVGAKLASNGLVCLVAGDTIRFDRITSAFTAGVGLAHVYCSILPAS